MLQSLTLLLVIPVITLFIIYGNLLHYDEMYTDIKNKFLRNRYSHTHISQTSTIKILNTHIETPIIPNKDIQSTFSKDEDVTWDTLKDLFELGQKDPLQLHEKLLSNDSNNLFSLTSTLDTTRITCSNKNTRIDYPDITNKKAIISFQNNLEDSFIFYQHVRKAGGTGFCELARSNLGTRYVPPYYCMPDNKGSLSTPPWNKPSYLLQQIHIHKYRIVANEWDVFLTEQSTLPNAVLATTLRHPIDRWYSQYRFEHLEHRDGSTGNNKPIPMLNWYKSQAPWTMGNHYYIKTFLGEKDPLPPKNKGDFYWTYHKYKQRQITYTDFTTAITNLRKFHILLITEYLNTSTPILEQMLHWKVPPKKVLPHESQAKRTIKDTRTSKEILSPSDYTWLIKENIFDVLFFAVAKRIYFERLTCIS